MPQNSLAQGLANHLNSEVHAFIKRTNYSSTWNDKNDIACRSKFISIEDQSIKSLSMLIRGYWKKALWNSQGAKNPPIGGETPYGLPTDMFIFEQGKEPYLKKIR